MNFFFGINNNNFKSQIQIPIFKNKELKISKIKLFKCFIKNKLWNIKEINKSKIDNYFFQLNDDEISNSEIYFLADDDVLKKFNPNNLSNYNDFTDTDPAFRANLKVFIPNKGFSSYQSEYPFSMVEKKGSILSSVSSLANIDAEKNFIFFKNIYNFPIQDTFIAYLINYTTKKIEEKFELISNYSNCIEIDKKFIKPEIFFATNSFLGIPIFISIDNGFISCEHTHPPHEYILSKNKYKKIQNLKNEINEIIS